MASDVLAAHAAPVDSGEVQERPHVVVMLADTLGYGDLGCHGSSGDLRGMATPNIDGLAAEELMLTQFFVEPGCTPTRTAPPIVVSSCNHAGG